MAQSEKSIIFAHSVDVSQSASIFGCPKGAFLIALDCLTPLNRQEKKVMKNWILFALTIAMVGVFCSDAEAGRRRSRWSRSCSSGSCTVVSAESNVNVTPTVISTCTGSSCGSVVSTVEHQTPVSSTPTIIQSSSNWSGCSNGRCYR